MAKYQLPWEVSEHADPTVYGDAMRRGTAIGSLPVRVVNACGQFLITSRLRFVDFDLGRLLNEACRRTALDDFGSMDFVSPLSMLLAAYDGEAQLTLVGRMAMREDILQSLMTRLYIEADRRRYPEIGDADITAPLIITGLPRSGTTFLHNLLAADQEWRAPAGWEVMYPSPPPGRGPNFQDPRIARAQKRMQQLYWLAPEFKVIHPLDATMPQECIAITSSAFVSDTYPTMCHIPSYQRWLDRADLTPSYQYHRRFLQQLQGGHEHLRWLLKAPAHLFGLDAIRSIYPDARIVFMHRDPVEVMPSLANLTLVLRSAFSDRHEPGNIGNELIDYWAKGMRRARSEILQWPDRHTRCIDIAYEALTSRPLDTVRRIYEHFDIELDGQALDGMQSYLQRRPKNQFGRHRYSLRQFSLDRDRVERAFEGLRGYCVE